MQQNSDINTVKALVTENYEIFKDFITKILKVRIKYGSLSIWLDEITNIAGFKEVIENIPNEEIGDFFRLYVDYSYLGNSSTNFKNLNEEEIKQLGKFIKLNDKEIKELSKLQK